ncbi:hypothetical protein J4423_02795 [Candidatus Pacearchaeota archaeon]|nr:hypothetical protein [Candidatus Pacearchaeota archaeon]
MVRKKLTLTIDEKILREYKEFCEKEGINISKRVEKYMKKDLNKNEI